MPNAQLCELAVVLDRSGSMQSIKADMEGGFATFIAEQRKDPSPCVVSLYQFDSVFNVVYEERPLSEATLELVPRGSTALLDALGKTIAMVGERLRAKPESERPGKVVVLVITDGYENASHEWSRARVKLAVEHQREKYNWQFAFLGANIDSFAEARSLGVAPQATMNYESNTKGVARAYRAVGMALNAYRGADSSACMSFDASRDEDKKEKAP